MNRKVKLVVAVGVALVVVLSLVFALPAFAEDTPNPKSSNPNVTYQTIPIGMMMEAGYSYAQDWWPDDPDDPNDAILHSGVGWLTPFGRAEYVAVRNWDGAEQYRPAFMAYDSWQHLFGSLGLFCVYRLPDGDIYAFDGIMGNIEPLANDDGKMDYLLNVIVGGTGRFEDAGGILLGITPGRGAEQPTGTGISLPDSILKLMEGYVEIVE